MRRILMMFAASLLLIPALAFAADDEIHFFGPGWADASGKDGKGGVSITCVGDKHNFVLRKDPCKEQVEARVAADHADWVVYDSDEDDDSLSYEFTWVTKPSDKFWAKLWAGGGLAFNKSWNAINITGAKYLVFYAKTNQPGTVDFNLALTGNSDSEQTGGVMLNDYAEGKKIGSDWTRVAIPIAALPDLAKINQAAVKTIRFDLKLNGCPENTPVYMHFTRMYFTDSNLVTPVENLGWLKVPDGVQVIWDKTNDEGVVKYLVTVDGKSAGRVEGASKRRVKSRPSFYLPEHPMWSASPRPTINWLPPINPSL